MSNDFLAWAVGGSANVESQSAYAADANLTNGYPANAIVPSGTLNKAIRQATFVAASVAQMVADNLATTVSDNGSVSSFEGQLRSALGYASGTQVWSFSSTSFSIYKALSVSGGISAGGGATISGGAATMYGACTGSFTQNPAVSGTFYTAIPYSTFSSGNPGFGLWLVLVVC